MRLNLYIAAALCWLTAEAAPRFTDPVWRPDLGISLPELAGAAAQQAEPEPPAPAAPALRQEVVEIPCSRATCATIP